MNPKTIFRIVTLAALALLTACASETYTPPEEEAVIIKLRNVRVRQQAQPGQEVLNGPDGEMQTLHGVTHVSVFPPFNQENGGPQNAFFYRIRATNAVTSQPVDLQQMRFGGISIAGVARFADR